MESFEGEVMKKKSKRLSMEDYLDFFDNRDVSRLTVTHLLQSELIDMVSSMELMDLRRSTLRDGGISSGTCITLKDVIEDLKRLDWKECNVTSLLILGVEASSSSTTATSHDSGPAKHKNSKKRKLKTQIEAGADTSVTSPGTTAAGSATQSSNF